jgi:hypothetical protein
MLTLRSQLRFVLAVTGLLCLSTIGWAQASESKGSAMAEHVAEAPVPSVTEVAEGHTLISYDSGQLTIKAHSAPLIDVLRAVCTQIGADLDVQSEPNEPVLGVFGPGPAKDVLPAMMGRSHFSLAMAGSPDDPNAIQRIVILPKSDTPDKTENASDAPTPQASIVENPTTEDQGNQAGDPTDTSRATAADVQATISQVREFFAQAQGELSQAGGGNLDTDAILKQAEAQAKAAVAADPNSPLPIASATNRPRRRSRHTH